MKTALARLAIPLARYREFVVQFGRENRDVAALIRERLEAGDLEGARVAAHTLKGVAGNLAATNLHVVAGVLEAAIKTGRPDKAARCLPELAALLTEVLNSAGILEQSMADAPDKVIPLADPARLSLLLAELSRMLARRELRALELFAHVRQQLTASEPARTEQQTKAMEQLDYRQALKDLQDLAARFSITLKEG